MDTKLIWFFLLFILPLKAITQSTSDSIIVYKETFSIYKFDYNGRLVTMDGLMDVLEDEPKALQYIKNAKASYTTSAICGGIGGFLIGWPLGTAAGGGEPEWTMAAVGGGFIALAIPLFFNSNRCTIKGVNLYNSSLNKNTVMQTDDMKMRLFQNGFSISITF